MRSLALRHERLTAERRSRKLKDLALSLCFIGPSVLGVLIFFVLPFCVVVYYSVIRNSINPEFVFLDNFIALFQNSAFRDAAKNTATFSALAVPLAVILSLGLAMLLEARIPLKSQFRTFFLSPMMVPVASVVLIWQVLFSNNGVINEFTALFGIAKIDWIKSEYGQIVILTLFLWKNLGYNMILFMSSLANIPLNLALYSIGAAQLSGGAGARFDWRKVLNMPVIATLLSVVLLLIIALISLVQLVVLRKREDIF